MRMLELYERIRNRREELQMTQDELAKKIGYKSRSSINKIERGENDIPQSKILSFARALNTTPDYLMGWEDVPNISQFNDDENQILLLYRRLSDTDRQAAFRMLNGLANQQVAHA